MSSVKDKEDPEGGLMKGVRGMNSSQITYLDSSHITHLVFPHSRFSGLT